MKSRAVMIGLDGVPHSLLNTLQEKGRIPNLASIFQKGYFGKMSVCIPEISSVSWSSFMTGTQPGEHGIYGFTDLEPNSYNMCFPNFSQLKTPTLWDDLAESGKKSIVINMPATYPARKINGVLISGFVAIDIDKAVYPSSITPHLKKMGYRIDIDTERARQDPEFLFLDLVETLEARERAVDFLWNEIDWDLFCVVITGTDRLMHFLWEAFENPSHPFHDRFLEYFQKVDAFVGRIYDRYMELEGSGENRNSFYMLSDHGFTAIKSEVYLNCWLQENGFLEFKNDRPFTIMDIGPKTLAFAMDPSRIYVNLKGRYPTGAVDKSSYARVCNEIREGLESLTNGYEEKIIKKVYTREELYAGESIGRAPDLIALSNTGYDLKGKVGSHEVFGRTNLSGMHSQDDAFFFGSNGAACHSIFDAKAIILKNISEDPQR